VMRPCFCRRRKTKRLSNGRRNRFRAIGSQRYYTSLRAAACEGVTMTPERRNALVIAAAILAALLTAFYALSRDKELAGDLLKALFGLSGGTTAGG